jgi:hypothetical protein
VDFGAEEAIFCQFIEKSEKKTRKGGKQRFFVFFG